MTSPREFLTFPLLRMRDRLRLAAFVALVPAAREHERRSTTVPLVEWLRGAVRRRTARAALAAAARLEVRRALRRPARHATSGRAPAGCRRRATRGREIMGWLVGRLQTPHRRACARASTQLGGEVHAATRVERDHRHARDGATGLVVDGARPPRSTTSLCTLAAAAGPGRCSSPSCARPPRHDHCRYLGVVCVVLRVDAQRQPLLHAQHHRPARAADDRGGDDARGRPRARRRHPALRRASTSTRTAPDLTRDADELDATPTSAHAADHASPSCADDGSSARSVQRARVVEPVHVLGGAARLPEMFPAPGLAAGLVRRTCTPRS